MTHAEKLALIEAMTGMQIRAGGVGYMSVQGEIMVSGHTNTIETVWIGKHPMLTYGPAKMFMHETDKTVDDMAADMTDAEYQLNLRNLTFAQELKNEPQTDVGDDDAGRIDAAGWPGEGW